MLWYLCGGEDAGLFLEMGLIEVLPSTEGAGSGCGYGLHYLVFAVVVVSLYRINLYFHLTLRACDSHFFKSGMR